MSENNGQQRRGAKVEIVVAIIGVVGVLGGALFANWDKIFPPNKAGGTSSRPFWRPPIRTAAMGALEYNTNRQAKDFSAVPYLVGSPEECAEMCSKNKDCKAMTFVKRPDQFSGGDCWLKNAVPQRSSAANMVSAVKIQ
jgi:hypothetical protein